MKNKFIKLIIGFTALGSLTLVGSSLANKNGASSFLKANAESSYYSSITSDMTGKTLLNALNKLNNSHRKTMGYNALKTYASSIDIDPNGTSNKIVGFYDNKLLGPKWDSAATWNREHVWPNSRGGGNVEGDLHMPRPASVDTNGDRGNKFFGSVSGTYDPGALGYPNYRGIAARIIFYCAIADTSLTIVAKNTDNQNNKTMGNLEDLLAWNIKYAPSTSSSAALELRVEQNRNETLAKSNFQGNRNPFIDHPEYACKIWGLTNDKTKQICAGNLPDGDDSEIPPDPTTYTKVSVSEALSAISKLSEKETTTDLYEVTGIVSSDVTVGKSGDFKFDIVDEKDSTKSLHIYYANPNGFTVKKDDIVKVQGNLCKWENGVAEVTNGVIVSVNSDDPIVPVDDVTYVNVTEAINATSGLKEGEITPNLYEVKGLVSSKSEVIINTSNVVTFDLMDENNANKVIKIYRTNTNGKGTPNKGDEVSVRGYLTKTYNGLIELSDSSIISLIHVEQPVEPVNGGCSNSIIASSVIVFSFSLMGITLLSVKKKKEK